MNTNKTHSLLIAGLLGALPFTANAQVAFTAGTVIGTQTQPNVNNLIDRSLADTPNNATTSFPGYTATNGNTPAGSTTRSNLTVGTLLNVADFNALIATSQAANQLSGVVNFSNSTGGSGTSFSGTNSTGTLVVDTGTNLTTDRLTVRNYTTAPFDPAVNVGTGNTNSSPVSGNGMLNFQTPTFTLGTQVDAVGFTQLHRDGNRTYTWSVRLVNQNDLTTQTVTLGSMAFNNLGAGIVPGDASASNYRFDTFVGYQAPTGFKIDQVTVSGTSFGNYDTFAYAVIPEPGTLALTAIGLGLAILGARRRRA